MIPDWREHLIPTGSPKRYILRAFVGEAHVKHMGYVGSTTYQDIWKNRDHSHRFAVLQDGDKFISADLWDSRADDWNAVHLGAHTVHTDLDAAIMASIISYDAAQEQLVMSLVRGLKQWITTRSSRVVGLTRR